MPNPKDVFRNPDKYWQFITAASDSDFEGQHFDRKEAARTDNDGQISKKDLKGLKGLKSQLIVCISAFANANQEGGLLALGA